MYLQGVDYRINMLWFSMLQFLKVELCYLKHISLIGNSLIQMKPICLFVSLTWEKILRG